MMSLPQIRRGRFRIGEVMAAVAVIAVACAWPVLILPAVGGLLVLAFLRLGLSYTDSFVVVALAGILLGLLLPPVASRCGRTPAPPAVPPPVLAGSPGNPAQTP